jgi:iron(III) transport system substrate-binding protein
VHALVQQKLGSKTLKEIKTLKDDPLGVEKSADEIKTRYAKIFGV